MTFRRLHLLSPLATTICNLLMVYVLYFVARIIYLMSTTAISHKGSH